MKSEFESVYKSKVRFEKAVADRHRNKSFDVASQRSNQNQSVMSN